MAQDPGPNGGSTQEAKEAQWVDIRIRVPRWLRQRLRMQAAMDGKPMQEIAGGILMRGYTTEQEDGRGRRPQRVPAGSPGTEP